jgi:hypothetical protein
MAITIRNPFSFLCEVAGGCSRTQFIWRVAPDKPSPATTLRCSTFMAYGHKSFRIRLEKEQGGGV